MLKWFTPGTWLILTMAAIALSGQNAAAQGKATVTDVKFKSMPVAATVAHDLMVTSQGQCGQIKIDFGDGSTFVIPSTTGRPLPGGDFVYATQHTYAKSGTVTVTATGTSACAGKASVVVAVGAAPPPVPGSRSATPAEEASRTLPREQQGAGDVPVQGTTATSSGTLAIQMLKVPPAVQRLTSRTPRQGTPLNAQVQSFTFLSVQPDDSPPVGDSPGGTVKLPAPKIPGSPYGSLIFKYRVSGVPPEVIDGATQPPEQQPKVCCFGMQFNYHTLFPSARLFITTLAPDVLVITVKNFPFFPPGYRTEVTMWVGGQGNLYQAEPVSIEWGPPM
jgi:hypothetical protein